MVMKLKIECIRGVNLKEQCIRLVAIDDDSTLNDLHDIIQKAVSFDNDHLYDFYSANSDAIHVKKNWYSMADDWDDRLDELEEVLLKDVWPLGRKKLYYWFDYGDSWIFEIRKMRSSKADGELECPAILERIGPNPEQYSW
jgi:hypothetical protein